MEFKLSERLTILMRDRGLSVLKLAKDIGASRSAVYSWITKKALPNFANACALADYFDVELDYLLGREV